MLKLVSFAFLPVLIVSPQSCLNEFAQRYDLSSDISPSSSPPWLVLLMYLVFYFAYSKWFSNDNRHNFTSAFLFI